MKTKFLSMVLILIFFISACVGCQNSNNKNDNIIYISFNSLNDKNYKQIKTPYDLLFLHDILNGNEKQNEFRITITNRVIDNGHKDARVKIGPHWGWTSKCIHIE